MIYIKKKKNSIGNLNTQSYQNTTKQNKNITHNFKAFTTTNKHIILRNRGRIICFLLNVLVGSLGYVFVGKTGEQKIHSYTATNGTESNHGKSFRRSNHSDPHRFSHEFRSLLDVKPSP